MQRGKDNSNIFFGKMDNSNMRVTTNYINMRVNKLTHNQLKYTLLPVGGSIIFLWWGHILFKYKIKILTTVMCLYKIYSVKNIK